MTPETLDAPPRPCAGLVLCLTVMLTLLVGCRGGAPAADASPAWHPVRPPASTTPVPPATPPPRTSQTSPAPATSPPTRATESSPPQSAELQSSQPVSEAPLLVGCWTPLRGRSPDWVFPLVRVRWRGETDPNEPALNRVQAYAQAHIQEIRRRPPSQPVWIVGYGWLGRSSYRDPASFLANERDATPQGTSGIWPDYGLRMWRQRQEAFVTHLKSAGVPLDFWAADNELYINEWSVNYQDAWTFRNIVLDPRWETHPLPGLGFPGAALLPPERVIHDQARWVKSKFDTPDHRLAHDHVMVAGQFVRNVALRHVMVEPVLEAYPGVLVSNYGSHARPLGAGDDDTPDIPSPPGQEAIWRKVAELAPQVRELPGVGNVASPVLYGGPRARGLTHRQAVDAMFDLVDGLIVRYGGPEYVVPWIAYPTFAQRQGQRNLSPEQYRRLIVGLAERGIRRILLWNGAAEAREPQAEAELLSVLEEAREVAARRLASQGAR